MKIFIITIIIILLLYLLITLIMFLLVSRKKEKDFSPMAKAVEETLKPYKDLIDKGNKWIEDKYKKKQVKDVYIKNSEGLTLHAVLIENKNHKGIMLEDHGYRSTSKRDIYPSCFHYYNLGYSLLLIDNRTAELSEGKYITFGVKESNDIISWTKYLNKKYPKTDIILAGVSMGASAILMSMNRINDNMNVKGIIADSAYISGYEEVKYCINHYFHIPGILFIDMINIWCQIIAKFNLKGRTTIRSMKDSKIPVLLIHGKKDDFVPPENSIITFKKYKGPKKLLLFSKASHGISYLVNPDYYVNSVKEFLNKGE